MPGVGAWASHSWLAGATAIVRGSCPEPAGGSLPAGGGLACCLSPALREAGPDGVIFDVSRETVGPRQHCSKAGTLSRP